MNPVAITTIKSIQNSRGSVFTKPFSRKFFVFFSKICKLECNTTSDWLNHNYGLTNQKLHYIQMLLNNEKLEEYGKKYSTEWVVNTDPDFQQV